MARSRERIAAADSITRTSEIRRRVHRRDQARARIDCATALDNAAASDFRIDRSTSALVCPDAADIHIDRSRNTSLRTSPNGSRRPRRAGTLLLLAPALGSSHYATQPRRHHPADRGRNDPIARKHI